MTDDGELARLAALAGIEPVYWDIRGQRHDTSPETARAILAAMGIPAGTPREVTLGLAALEEEPWREVLPPVIVGREGAATPLMLHLAADRSAGAMAWTVHLEGGTALPHRHDIDALVAVGARKIDGRAIERRTVWLPPLPCGYHRVEFMDDTGAISAPVIIASAQCYLPPAMATGQRSWGISAQLYAMRMARNQGIGDFTDLGALLDWAGERGAAAVGINPLHALFPNAPADASPYSPNSRQFLNPLYLDIAAVADFAESSHAQALLSAPETRAKIAAVRAADLVDYEAVSAIKRPLFDAVYESFRLRHLGVARDPRAASFKDFQACCGHALERFALHALLCETFGTRDWTAWPPAYHDPASDDCVRLAQEHGERLVFHQYLQWQCDLQLSGAADRGRRQGMPIGIYGDLAVSASPDGADVWGAQDIFVADARVGAPPDPFNEAGQEWGIVPMNPARMRKTGYAKFIALLRANMRHFGALRIDHAMGLQRQFWIPAGFPTASGAYVKYPLDDLLAIVTLESQRNACLVIGEDLGTVPEGFRGRMAAANLLSYRVLYFETENGAFRRPDAYPALAAACVSTHDLPTLRGFWEESDLADRMRAGVFEMEDEFRRARSTRRADKRALLLALAEAGLLPVTVDRHAAESTILTVELAVAIHRFLARSASCLFMVQIDDIAGEAAQANMPGTTNTYPNWRHRLRIPLAQMVHSEVARQIVDAVVEERPRPARKE